MHLQAFGDNLISPKYPDTMKLSIQSAPDQLNLIPPQDRQIHLKFFDTNTTNPVRDVTFVMIVTKGNQTFLQNTFWTQSGSFTLNLKPGERYLWTANPDHDPMDGLYYSKGDQIDIWTSYLTDDVYYFSIQPVVVNQNDLRQQNVGGKFMTDLNLLSTYNETLVPNVNIASSVNQLEVSSPLKQFKSGIAVNDVKCRQGLQLVIKAKDNSPACVKLDAAYILIKRGWAASESAYPGGDRQFALDTNSTIIPAHLPRSSGVRVPYSESSRVINYSGFYGVYNETFPYRGTQNDYVLKPGNTGVITFQIDAMVSEQQDQDYSIPLPKSINRTNYVIFYHEIKNLKDLSKYPGVTFDSNNYDVCSTGPAGRSSCIGEQFGGTGPIEAFVTDHSGVDVLFEPPSEVLPLSMNTTSQIVTMTITVDGDAPRGTYLALLPGIGMDSFLLTVGNQPYHE
ncbi:MAG TPA: hypothetical protein VFJ23_02305 [Candidatus Nitrosotalea sp.]|nr:hypothetical protein [Candidatus Nitrosotalea sp.]